METSSTTLSNDHTIKLILGRKGNTEIRGNTRNRENEGNRTTTGQRACWEYDAGNRGNTVRRETLGTEGTREALATWETLETLGTKGLEGIGGTLANEETVIRNRGCRRDENIGKRPNTGNWWSRRLTRNGGNTEYRETRGNRGTTRRIERAGSTTDTKLTPE